MRTVLTALFLALSATTATAVPAPDPLLEKLIAGARAVPASSISFERTLRATGQDEGKAPESSIRIDRWDGTQLTLVSINGVSATAEQIAAQRKAAAGRPVPGYHRIADYLKGGARRLPDAQGRTVYRIDKLPKGSVNIGKDVSENLIGDLIVDTSGPQPYVSRLHIFLPKPLSFFLVAKLDSFDLVGDYKISNGRPTLVHVVQSLAGAQMGKSGNTRTESTFAPLK